MPDIKTRDVAKGTIKQIDKAAVAADRMRSTYISTKEKAEHTTHAAEANPEEYASDKVQYGTERVTHEAVHQFDKQGRKGVEQTKENIQKSKEQIKRFKEKRAEKALDRQTAHRSGETVSKTGDSVYRSSSPVRQSGKQAGKATRQQTGKAVKQSARSAGKKTVKTTAKGSVKTAQKTVKTAERTAKTTIKTSKAAAKTAAKTAKATAKAAQRAAQAAKVAAKAVIAGIKLAAKATVAAVKAIIAAIKGLIAAIAAGGWIAVVVIIVICLIALIIGSVFGIFFSGDSPSDNGDYISMPTAVQEINADYDGQLTSIRNGTAYDELEMSGSRAVWKEVIAVYAVKTNTDPDNAQEVATMDEEKKQLLTDIFWEMNDISSRSETKTVTVIEESDDGYGNIVQTEREETETILYITVAHKTADEMASQYGFNDEQKELLAELLSDENNSLWAAVLYGIGYSDDQIVTVALSQVGNVGGDPYWSWYGFNSRVEWCACFVSWCANECGYIESGIIPKYAGCVNGVQWFKDRGQWADGDVEPVPGMIIFFDWDDPDGSAGPQDGESDHTGIVQKVEDGIVYTVEGNSGDSCRVNHYAVGYYEILGYGIPQY